MSQSKRPFSSISSTTPSSSISPLQSESQSQIYSSQPIIDRKSKFIGYFSPSIPPYDLQSQSSFSSATHKILAYRIPSSSALSSSSTPTDVRESAKRQKTLPFSSTTPTSDLRSSTVTPSSSNAREIIKEGSSDDGESHASKHILSTLRKENVLGSCVVARWYGGVMLGPVRFQHIEDATRSAITTWRGTLSTIPTTNDVKTVNDGKTDEQKRDEAAERKTLLVELAFRDESIVSLRGLLEQKKQALQGLGNGSCSKDVQTGLVKEIKVDYTTYTLERLRGLDRARDGTITFLLKQIESVEKEIENVEKDLLEEAQKTTTMD